MCPYQPALALWSSQGTHLIPSSRCLTHLNLHSLSEPLLHAWGGGVSDSPYVQDFRTYVCIKFGYFSLANLSHVYLIIRPARITLQIKQSLCLLSPTPGISFLGIAFRGLISKLHTRKFRSAPLLPTQPQGEFTVSNLTIQHVHQIWPQIIQDYFQISIEQAKDVLVLTEKPRTNVSLTAWGGRIEGGAF